MSRQTKTEKVLRLAAGSGSTHGFLGWAGFLGRVGSKTPTQSTGLGPGGQPMGAGWVEKFDPTRPNGKPMHKLYFKILLSFIKSCIGTTFSFLPPSKLRTRYWPNSSQTQVF